MKWYPAMDVLVFQTQFEEFGLVPLEAQVSNLKVLCADVVPLQRQILVPYLSLIQIYGLIN